MLETIKKINIKQHILFISTLSGLITHASAPEHELLHKKNPIKKTYGPVTPKIRSLNNHNVPSIEINLFQEVLYTYEKPIKNEPFGFISNDCIGYVSCAYYHQEKTGYIKKIEINMQNRQKGYGSFLFRQSVAHLQTTFLDCKYIFFTAYPFLDSTNYQAHKKLVAFYTKLGAIQCSKMDITKGTAMKYPLYLAAMLSALLPVFIPNPDTKNKVLKLTSGENTINIMKHDILGIITSYMDQIDDA